MRSAYRLRGFGTDAPTPLRRYARAHAYPGLPAFASLSMAGSVGAEKLAELRARRVTRDKREADRIKAVVLLTTGWSTEQVTEVLQADPNTVRNYLALLRLVWARGQVALVPSASNRCL
jgi:hypothetical protein